MTEFYNMDKNWVDNMDETCNAVEDRELANKTYTLSKQLPKTA